MVKHCGINFYTRPYSFSLQGYELVQRSKAKVVTRKESSMQFRCLERMFGQGNVGVRHGKVVVFVDRER